MRNVQGECHDCQRRAVKRLFTVGEPRTGAHYDDFMICACLDGKVSTRASQKLQGIGRFHWIVGLEALCRGRLASY